MFNSAATFQIAAVRCLDEELNADKTFILALYPAIVNFAFAAELYLKSMIENQGTKMFGHKLDALFKHLIPATQQIIFKHYSKIINSSEHQFLVDIQSLSNAFVDTRYIHKNNNAITIKPYKLAVLCRPLYDAATELSPDWEMKGVAHARIASGNIQSTISVAYEGGNSIRMKFDAGSTISATFTVVHPP